MQLQGRLSLCPCQPAPKAASSPHLQSVACCLASPHRKLDVPSHLQSVATAVATAIAQTGWSVEGRPGCVGQAKAPASPHARAPADTYANGGRWICEVGSWGRLAHCYSELDAHCMGLAALGTFSPTCCHPHTTLQAVSTAGCADKAAASTSSESVQKTFADVSRAACGLLHRTRGEAQHHLSQAAAHPPWSAPDLPAGCCESVDSSCG